jgi:tape measure domain-containing protein
MADNKTEYIITLKDLFTKGINDADSATTKLDSNVNNLQKTIGRLATVVGIGAFARSVFNTTLQVDSLNTSLDFISKGKGVETFKYLNEQSDKLGLNLESAAQGYKQIAGAARGTILEGKVVRDIFEGVSMATTTFGLSSEQSEGALLALSQMISKGKVQAEELRGQLGERIPGAFQIAARAMNMTTAELDKFMADGKLLAEDFLPKFASQLKREFTDGAAEAASGLQAETNRLTNEFFLLKAQIGNDLKPVLIEAMKILRSIISVVRDIIGWMKQHSSTIKIVTSAFVALVGSVILYNKYILISRAITSAYAVVQGVQLVGALTGATTAQIALNAAMYANPVGLVIAGLTALVGVLLTIRDHFKAIQDAYSSAAQNLKVQAIQTETKNVLALADAYEKQGKTRVEAERMALAEENKVIDAKIKRLMWELRLAQIAQIKQMNSYMGLGTFAADDELKQVLALQGALKAAVGQKSILNKSVFTKAAEAKNANETIKGVAGVDSAKSPEHKVITINIDKLIEKFTIATNTVAEGTQNLKEQIVKALIEAVNDAQIIAGI